MTNRNQKLCDNHRMRAFTYLLIAILLGGCAAAPTVQRPARTAEQPALVSDNRSIDRLLLEASRTIPPRSTELRLQAAELAMAASDFELTERIINVIESPYLSEANTRAYSLIYAELALHQNNPTLAIKLLEDRRFQRLRLDTSTQLQTGLLRANAYRMGRSYLASARELIYVNRLIPNERRQRNHEDIFSTINTIHYAN